MPCPCGHGPRPCTCVQSPKKSTPQLIKPRRQDLVDELQLWINHSFPDTPTGMSTTLSKYCLGPHVDNLTGHRQPVVAHQRACNNMSRPPRTATVGASLSHPRLHSRTGHAQQTSTTVSMYSNWRISVVSEPEESSTAPRQGCQRHCSKKKTSCNCGISTVSSKLRPNLQDLHNKRRSPCQGTATVESPWSQGPWESASAPQQGIVDDLDEQQLRDLH